jgi:hypothetical protein
MNLNWDGVSFVKMKENPIDSPLLAIDHDDFVAKCEVGCEIIATLTKKRKTTKDIQVAQAHQH